MELQNRSSNASKSAVNKGRLGTLSRFNSRGALHYTQKDVDNGKHYLEENSNESKFYPVLVQDELRCFHATMEMNSVHEWVNLESEQISKHISYTY